MVPYIYEKHNIAITFRKNFKNVKKYFKEHKGCKEGLNFAQDS